MTTYEMPSDGFDWCFSCNYLKEVATVYTLDIADGVPLCKECAKEIGA